MTDVIGSQFGSPAWALWTIPVSVAVLVLSTVAYLRLVGLRSFSKMSGFDFAVTVAVGSTIGGVALSTGSGSSLGNGVIALGSLLLFQAVVALVRRRVAGVSEAIDNDPLLLMAGGRVLEDNLRAARITRSDLHAKLREANVLHPAQIKAVVLETTGDVSVLHGDEELDLDLLAGVRDVEALRPR